MPTPSINRLPVRRQIPVPIPDPNARGNTEVINETNVQVIGYAKDKESVEVEEKVWTCPNCQRKAVVKTYGRDRVSEPNVVVRKSYEGIDKYWH